MLHKLLFKAPVKEPESVYRDSSRSHRENFKRDVMMQPTTWPRILLIDDDPSYGKIMQRAASQNGVTLTYCQDLDQFGALDSYDFDVAIVDYDLGAVTGYELTSYLEHYTKEDLPVILVSQTTQKASRKWPPTIREFVHKNLGPFAALEAAYEAHEISNIHSHIKAG